jgi:hypothetical protein
MQDDSRPTMVGFADATRDGLLAEGHMRNTITVERSATSYGSYLVGADATRVLVAISGITAIQVEKQYIDRATISFESSERSPNFDRIDAMLQLKGMQRVQQVSA